MKKTKRNKSAETEANIPNTFSEATESVSPETYSGVIAEKIRHAEREFKIEGNFFSKISFIIKNFSLILNFAWQALGELQKLTEIKEEIVQKAKGIDLSEKDLKQREIELQQSQKKLLETQKKLAQDQQKLTEDQSAVATREQNINKTIAEKFKKEIETRAVELKQEIEKKVQTAQSQLNSLKNECLKKEDEQNCLTQKIVELNVELVNHEKQLIEKINEKKTEIAQLDADCDKLKAEKIQRERHVEETKAKLQGAVIQAMPELLESFVKITEQHSVERQESDKRAAEERKWIQEKGAEERDQIRKENSTIIKEINKDASIERIQMQKRNSALISEISEGARKERISMNKHFLVMLETLEAGHNETVRTIMTENTETLRIRANENQQAIEFLQKEAASRRQELENTQRNQERMIGHMAHGNERLFVGATAALRHIDNISSRQWTNAPLPAALPTTVNNVTDNSVTTTIDRSNHNHSKRNTTIGISNNNLEANTTTTYNSKHSSKTNTTTIDNSIHSSSNRIDTTNNSTTNNTSIIDASDNSQHISDFIDPALVEEVFIPFDAASQPRPHLYDFSY